MGIAFSRSNYGSYLVLLLLLIMRIFQNGILRMLKLQKVKVIQYILLVMTQKTTAMLILCFHIYYRCEDKNCKFLSANIA